MLWSMQKSAKVNLNSLINFLNLYFHKISLFFLILLFNYSFQIQKFNNDLYCLETFGKSFQIYYAV